METIHYISDFKYFSSRSLSPSYRDVWHALLCHINYISRNNSETFNLNKRVWRQRVEQETKKRWDSRVALSFIIALPNFLTFEEYKEMLVNFLTKELNIPAEHLSFAIHRSNTNTHAHILIYPLDINGKKLRINASKLKQFHRNWDKFLQEQGFFIKRDEDSLKKLPPLSPFAQKVYEEHYNLKQLKKELELLEKEKTQKVKTIEQKFSFFEKLKQLLKERTMEKDFVQKQKEQIEKYLSVLYDEDDLIAVEAIFKREKRAKIFNNNVIKVKDLKRDNVLRVLRALNSRGFNIYISLNTLKEAAKGRKSEFFKQKQNKIYIDLDAKDESGKQRIARLYTLLRKYSLPSPTIILKSSKGNYQIIWVFNEKIDFSVLKKIMIRLESELNSDAVHDISRVFRLPYFFNCKYSPRQLSVLVDSLTVYNTKSEKAGKIRATYSRTSFKQFEKLAEDIKYPLADIVKKIEKKKKEKEYRQKVVKECTKKIADKVFAKSWLERVYAQVQKSNYKSPSEADMAFVAHVLNPLAPSDRERAKAEIIEFLTTKALERKKRSDINKAREYASLTVSKYVPLSQKAKEAQKANKSTTERKKPSSSKPPLSL